MGEKRVITLVLVALLLAGCGSVGSLTNVPPGTTTENIPPAVVSVLPPADGTAPADTAISLTFNKPMSPSGFEIRSEPTVTFGPAQWSDDAKTVTVRPVGSLTSGVRYTVRVRARDRQGNSLGQDRVWSFTATAPAGMSGEGQIRLADRIDVAADQRVFTLFAALLAASPGAAGGDVGAVRAAVRSKSADLPARVVEPVRRFLSDQAGTVEQHVAAALALGPPPAFQEQAAARPEPTRTPVATPTPRPTATTAAAREAPGLGPVLAQFYAGAGLADLWRAHEQAHTQAVEAFRREAAAVLGRATDYLRVAAVPAARILVVPNPVDQAGQGYLIRQGDRVALVVGTSAGVDRLGLLRPYIRLLLEPLRGQAPDQIQRSERLFAQVREVAVRHGYGTWSEVIAESLVEAVAIRLATAGDEAAAAAAQRAAYGRGLILVDHFATQLAEYERTTTALVDFYARMMAAVDLDVELRRWAERRPG